MRRRRSERLRGIKEALSLRLRVGFWVTFVCGSNVGLEVVEEPLRWSENLRWSA